MSAPWYKCFPRDFNEGMVGLTLEERGAYITILNLIYARSGPIPEDDWWITSQLGCTKRAWVKIRAALIVKGKLTAEEIDGKPHLMNDRARSEIGVRQKVSEQNSDAGKIGGEKSAAVRKENSDLAKRPLETPEADGKPYQISDIREQKDGGGDAHAREAQVIHLAPDQPDDWPNGDCAKLLVEVVASPWLDPQKSAGLVTTAGRLAAWRREGLSWEHDVVPIVTKLARKQRAPIASWKFFDPAMGRALDANREALKSPEVRVYAQRPVNDQRGSAVVERYSNIDAAMAAAEQLDPRRSGGG